MEDVIARLTNNGESANDICLFFIVNNGDIYLEYLDKLQIRGKQLETFIYKCCDTLDYDEITNILLLISWDVFPIDLVLKNINSNNPIKLIQEPQKDNEHWMSAYKRYYNTFIDIMNSKNR